jgi:Membrane-bound serine protease (ClpP class)
MDAALQFIVTNLPMILCLIVGVGLLVVEVFVPGFGLPGISGIALLTVGIIITWNTYGPVAGLAVTLIALALAGIAISVSVKSAATGKLSKSALILKETTQTVDHEETEALLGREGVTVTVLNPVGVADFDGVRLNVVSEGTFLAKGAKVQVTKVEGTKIIVRETAG